MGKIEQSRSLEDAEWFYTKVFRADYRVVLFL
jgi:hypothetical protein